MPYPYFFGNLMQNVPKTPQQLEAEQKALMEQYSKTYDSMMNTSAGNGRNTYIRTSDFELVKQAQPPSDGTPMVFLDEEHMCMYSKKYVNGVPCIQTFGLTPMENPAGAMKENGSIESKIDSIITRLDSLEGRIGGIEHDKPPDKGSDESSQG